MLLWRISNHTDLSGRGGERLAGRWHTPSEGKRIVYCAEHPAVALIENLANLRGDPTLFPDAFQLLRIHAPKPRIEELNADQLAAVDAEDRAPTQAIGDAWLAAGRSALLRVPSIPSPESWNYLLNPLHPDARNLHVEWARRIAYDKRLFRIEPESTSELPHA